MIRLRQITARAARVEQLAKGLAKEAAQLQMTSWAAALNTQQRRYLAAVRKAKAALDEALVALQDAAHQLQGHPLA